jgi:hypothetical protein
MHKARGRKAGGYVYLCSFARKLVISAIIRQSHGLLDSPVAPANHRAARIRRSADEDSSNDLLSHAIF